MSELPQPLVPAEVDLKDFGFMPLEFRRLFASDTWILGNAEERCAAVCLWCESWHQAPAGSLPDNDRLLAHLSQSGARWPKLREHALRGWQKCSDGRLYHPVVCEKVLEAWAKHTKASSKGKAGAEKRWGTRKKSDSTSTGSTTKNDAMEVNREGTELNRTEVSGLPSTGGSATTPAATIAIALRSLGVKGVNGSMHGTIQAWVRDGFTPEQAESAAKTAINERGKPDPSLAYVDRILRDPNRKSSNADAVAEAGRRIFGGEREAN